MTIERRKISADIERKIAIGMITDSGFLRDIIPILDDSSLLSVPFVRTVANWCTDHWNAYQVAPGKAIIDVYQAQLRRGNIPAPEQELLEDFLESLSEEWVADAGFNSEFWLDEAERHLDKQAIQMTAEDVQALLVSGDLDEARELLEGYRQIKRPAAHAINPFDDAVIQAAFQDAQEPLLKFSGALGSFANHLFTRGSLVGIMAPEKRGKSWMLQELALRAVMSRRKVVFFSVGDMTRDQMVRRIGIRLTGGNYLQRECGEAPVPVYDCKRNQKGGCFMPARTWKGKLEDAEGMTLDPRDYFKRWSEGIEYEPCDHCRRSDDKWYPAHWWKKEEVTLLTPGKVRRKARAWLKRYGDRMRLYEYGYWELNVKEIEAELIRLKEQDDFLADFVIIDYADNMGPEDPRVSEERHRQNQTWGALSALRKRWHNCIITATQTDAASYNNDDIGMRNFSEDKRKLGHATAMLALNQKPWEKREGVMRLGLVLARETEFFVDRQVAILQSLKIGRPIMGSYRLWGNR